MNNETLYWATADVLAAAVRLESGKSMPSPPALREELLGLLRQMVSRARAFGVPDTETAEARYAVVAFIDDRILKSNWNGRAEWMSNPLQLQLYREYAAGENFFARMRALLARGAPLAALEIYYLCLAGGFTGATTGGAQTARSYLDAARTRLPARASGEAISPRAIPLDRPALIARKRPLALGLAIGCACVVLLGLGLLQFSLSGELSRTTLDLAASDATHPRIAPGVR